MLLQSMIASYLFLIMNLTISSSKATHKGQYSPFATPTHQQQQEQVHLSPPTAQCSAFFYSCLASESLQEYQFPQITQHAKPRRPLSPSSHPQVNALQNNQQPHRRVKISLSLNLKHSRQTTPSKEHPQRYSSQQKKFKTEQGNVETGGERSRAIKLKTEPKRSQQGIHRLKQSHKPSTQHSAKKSNDSGRMKLTLSGAFKSQINSAQQHALPQTLPPSSSVVIEQSFMTARLANIYAGSELQLFPNSNIVYYNQLMANDWRGGGQEKERRQISIQNIQADDPHEENQYTPNVKSKFKERKWIGQYAKTIKTFNESQLRSNELNSQAESIVLEKGHHTFMPLNRCSSKDCTENSANDRRRRGYGSVGEQYGALSVTNQSKFKLSSPPIAEDLQQSQHWE